MPTNYASSYSKQTLQAFTLASLTRGRLSGRADFVADSGKSVRIFTNGTAKMNDYKRTGSDRFGTPTDLDNTVQELTCTKERSFSTVLDGVDAIDMGATMEEAGAFLRRQIDEVITPEVDVYTLSKLAAGADTSNIITRTVAKGSAYETFLDANSLLDDSLTPLDGRFAYVSSAFYKYLKLDDSFIKATDLAQDMLVKGQVGEVDGVAIIKAPAAYLPTNTDLLIMHKDAACQPIRLEQYNIYDKVQGYSGPVVEGLIYYDAFVYDARKKSIATVTKGE